MASEDDVHFTTQVRVFVLVGDGCSRSVLATKLNENAHCFGAKMSLGRSQQHDDKDGKSGPGRLPPVDQHGTVGDHSSHHLVEATPPGASETGADAPPQGRPVFGAGRESTKQWNFR